MGKIKVLSKEISELIAAGEVIERPSSVIKELIENSIDANATAITVEIKNGGRTFMRITDNGCGMSEEDVSVAFVRHATSKIETKNDLNSIFTLGFRGEALASVCAVAKVDVLTKQKENQYGTHYIVEGAEEKLCEPSGCPDGTTIIIRDLFFNVPARLKFLKKDVTEGNNISAIVSRLSLSHPEISFKFIRDNKPEIITPGDGKLFSAIYTVFGREFANSLLPVSYSLNGIEVEGFASKPLLSRSNRTMQNYFVNNRYVKSVTCMVSLEEAYKNSIMTGKFPACVLNLIIPPSLVDVNVHPAKTEIRFSDEKLIYEAVYFAVKNALLAFDTPNELRLEKTQNYSEKVLREVPKDDVTHNQTTIFVAQQGTPTKLESSENTRKYDRALAIEKSERQVDNTYLESVEIIKEVANTSLQPAAVSNTPSQPKEQVGDSCADLEAFKYINSSSFVKKEETKTVNNPEISKEPLDIKVLGELFMTYIVVQAGNDMLLIDKHAAHERYLFEQLKEEIEFLHTQMLLEPETLLMSYEEYDALANNIELSENLGFVLKCDTAPNVICEGIPAALEDYDVTELITELASNILANMKNPMVSVADELFHSIACRAAIKANDLSSIEELTRLARLVLERDDLRYCPHGRPIMITLSKRDIEKQFKRII